MTLDREKMSRIARDSYLPVASRLFGNNGSDALRNCMRAIIKIYSQVEPEQISGSLIITHMVPGVCDKRPTYQSLDGSVSIGITVSDLTRIPAVFSEEVRQSLTIIEVLNNGDACVHVMMMEPDVFDLSKKAIVYSFSNRTERFYIGGEVRDIVNPSKGVHLSVYAIPTYRRLDSALEDYKINSVRMSSCPILMDTWETRKRLIFINRPESNMQRSLAHYLSIILRGDAEVHREKVVDDSHPVDLEVRWQFTNRVALIEIKWLGDSRSSSGGLTSYRESRAKDGAKQLADYLDSKASQSPLNDKKGYLVVVDGRRAGLKADTEELTLSQAFHYSNEEVSYNPDFSNTREDFAEPIRMYAEPRRSECKPD